MTTPARRHLTLYSSVLAFVLATGCDKLDEHNPFGDGAAQAAPSSSSPTAPGTAAPVAEPAALTTAEVAYAAGRKWAFSSMFAFLGEAASSAETYGQASVAAKRLGLTLPPNATKEDALDKLRGNGPVKDLKAAHGLPVAVSFALGAKLTESMLVVELGIESKQLFDDIEYAATNGNVPKASFEKELGAARAAPSRETAQALSKAFDTYFHYEDGANGRAWSSTDALAPAPVPSAGGSPTGVAG